MKRKLLLILAFLLFCRFCCLAVTPVVKLGLEWGFDPQIASMHKYNYVCAEGYRVNDQWSGMDYHTNANVLANINFKLGQWFELGIYSGYCGVSKGVNVVPVTLRLSFFPKETDNSGFLYYLDAGPGFHLNKSTDPSQAPWMLTKIGAGYRCILSKNASLDILVSGRITIDNPLIMDPDGHGYVLDVRYNSAAYYALGFGMALNF